MNSFVSKIFILFLVLTAMVTFAGENRENNFYITYFILNVFILTSLKDAARIGTASKTKTTTTKPSIIVGGRGGTSKCTMGPAYWCCNSEAESNGCGKVS
jgi:hypothetical protein